MGGSTADYKLTKMKTEYLTENLNLVSASLIINPDAL